MAPNVAPCKKPNKTLVAATFEKAKTYIFARTYIWDREVGVSNPLAPTNHINNLRLPTLAAVSLVWEIFDQNSENPLFFELHSANVSHCNLQILVAHQHHYWLKPRIQLVLGAYRTWNQVVPPQSFNSHHSTVRMKGSLDVCEGSTRVCVSKHIFCYTFSARSDY